MLVAAKNMALTNTLKRQPDNKSKMQKWERTEEEKRALDFVSSSFEARERWSFSISVFRRKKKEKKKSMMHGGISTLKM